MPPTARTGVNDLIWNIVTAVATVISMVAFILTALYIRAELRSLEKDRFVNITSELFSVWQSPDFMAAQLWLIHKLEERSWADFVNAHRGDTGEIAFHRVGSFYDRVGTLVRLGLVSEAEILSTIGAFAIAVWQKVEPLILEARRIENSTLFDDFEKLLPACHECYVPALGTSARVAPFSLAQPGALIRPAALKPVKKISADELKRMMDAGEPVTVLDVRQRGHVTADPRHIPGSLPIPPEEVESRLEEIPKERAVVTLCA
jgi:hypothetical protein